MQNCLIKTNLPWWNFIIPAAVTQETTYSEKPDKIVVVMYKRWLNFTWNVQIGEWS
jgi:hypothetical protein